MPSRIYKAKENFLKLNMPISLVTSAIKNLKYWLLHPDFENYQEQIEYLIETEEFEELFDSFYQVIPFGTGGRRGKVGVGPNRINPWTIAASAQGHSQYLIKKYGEEAKSRGIVIAYDVRQYMPKGLSLPLKWETISDNLDSRLHGNDKDEKTTLNSKELIVGNQQPQHTHPLFGVTSRDLAEITASVYAKNNIKVHFFHDITSTPQLSFTIRFLKAIAGINISASHNPPDYNGKKVYDEFGGQLIPPFDQQLADEVNNHVNIFDVEWGIFDRHIQKNEVEIINRNIEEDYSKAVSKISLSNNRKARVLFSSLHGTGKSNIFKTMKNLDFDIHLDGDSSIPSGEFETVPNQIANPELPAVYDGLKAQAEKIKANLIITSDPDADRMGISVNHNGDWVFLDGNQTATLLTYYVLSKNNSKHSLVLTTIPVTKLIEKICKKFNAENRNHYLPGFKYFGDAMNQFEKHKQMHRVLIAMEDTLGHLAGNYARDKDGCVGSILLSELAGELIEENKTLVDKLDEIYLEFGYFKNIVTEIKFDNSYERGEIEEIMRKFRTSANKIFTGIEISKFTDHWHETKILSSTDKSSKNLLEFLIDPSKSDLIDSIIDSVRIIIRPSGTEPKLKIYIEVSVASGFESLENIKATCEETVEKIVGVVKGSIYEE